jgi:hypothetical protein
MLDNQPIASDAYVEGPTPSRYWGDQWLRVAEKILKGLNHDLTNRVTSLEAAVGHDDPAETIPESASRSLGVEVQRLHGLLRLYRMLTTEALEEPEAVRLQDLMPEVMRLHAHHADLRNVAVELHGDAETLPVIVRQSALVRCTLVLAASATGNALRAGSKHPVQVRYGGNPQQVFVRIIGPTPRDQLMFTGDGSLVHAVRTALAHASGSIEGIVRHGDEGDWIEYDLRLPTLTEVRARASA